MSDEGRRRLEEAGSRPVPGPDPEFADALEARLRAVAASRPLAGPPPPRGRVLLRRRLAAACAALAVLAAAVGLLAIEQAPAAARELVAPVNVEVSLADGTTVADPDGLQLPEGAVVRVGAGGSARIDGTVLGPGDIATVANGRIVVQHRPPVGGLPGPSSTRSPSPLATPGSSARPVVVPTPSPTRTPRPTPSPSAPVATLPASPKPSSTARPTIAPTPTPAPTPRIVRPKLRARAVGRTIAVTWTGTARARSYVLVVSRSRSGPAANPAYPGSRVVGVFARPPEKPLRVRAGAGVVEVRLMVVALRRDGAVLRRSRVVIVAVPLASSGP